MSETIENQLLKASNDSILQIDKKEIIKIYNNIDEIIAQNPKFIKRNIQSCLNGKTRTSYTYEWEYKKDFVLSTIPISYNASNDKCQTISNISNDKCQTICNDKYETISNIFSDKCQTIFNISNNKCQTICSDKCQTICSDKCETIETELLKASNDSILQIYIAKKEIIKIALIALIKIS